MASKTNKTGSTTAEKKSSTAKSTSKKDEVLKETAPKKAAVNSDAAIAKVEKSVTVAAPKAESAKVENTIEAKKADTASSSLPTFTLEDVATCAYIMWEKDGYQHGYDKDYWFRAEETLKSLCATRK
jgi:hypothetical protein